MKREIYWHTTVDVPESDPPHVPERVDVAIIGAGYTGLSAARTLASRGVQTVVLDAESPGWGASSRNGGMTLTGLKPSMGKIVHRYGRELAKQLFQYSLDSIDTVEQIVREENIDCGFERTGHLVVANKLRHYEVLKTQAELMAKEFHHDVDLIAARDLQGEIGSAVYYGGLVDESSGGLNPAQFVAGLANAARKTGAMICGRSPVEKVERYGTSFKLQTQKNSCIADSVLVATSGYTGNTTKDLQKKIIPIGSFMIATEKLENDVARELSPKNRMIFDSRRFLNYFRIWDNRLLFGGRAAFFPETKNTISQSAAILKRDMLRVYPQLQKVQVEYVWGGTLDFTFDMMPHAGIMNGLYYALGYAGHGVAMGTHLGKKMAEAMLNGSLKEIPFASYPFRGAPLGLYNGRPWFLPLAAFWYRFLDLID